MDGFLYADVIPEECNWQLGMYTLQFIGDVVSELLLGYHA